MFKKNYKLYVADDGRMHRGATDIAITKSVETAIRKQLHAALDELEELKADIAKSHKPDEMIPRIIALQAEANLQRGFAEMYKAAMESYIDEATRLRLDRDVRKFKLKQFESILRDDALIHAAVDALLGSGEGSDEWKTVVSNTTEVLAKFVRALFTLAHQKMEQKDIVELTSLEEENKQLKEELELAKSQLGGVPHS